MFLKDSYPPPMKELFLVFVGLFSCVLKEGMNHYCLISIHIISMYTQIYIYNILYKLALIYEFMNGYTHLSHSFIIYAFSLKTDWDRQISMVRSSHVPPEYKGKTVKVSKATGSASCNVCWCTICRHVRHHAWCVHSSPWRHLICSDCAPCQNLDFREVGGWVKKVSMAVHKLINWS